MGIVGALVLKALTFIGDAYNAGDTIVRGVGDVLLKAFGIGG